MQAAFSGLLLACIFLAIAINFKNVRIVGLIFIGVLSVTLMSIIGIDVGRMIVSIGIICISLILLLFVRKKVKFTMLSLAGLILLIVFFMLFLGSYIYSPAISSEYAVWKLRQFFILAFIPSFLILMVGHIKEKEMRGIENFIICTSVLTSLLVLVNLQMSGGFSALQSDWFARQSLGEMNPIWLSRFLGLGLLVLQSPRFDKHPVIVMTLSVLMVIASLMTGSKTVLYFTVPVILSYRILSRGINKKLFVNLGLITGVSAAIFWFLSSITTNALMTRFSLGSDTVSQRELMYDSSITSYFNSGGFNLFFGNGGGTIGTSLGFGYVREYPHNLLIEVLFEMGLAGFLLLLLFLIFSLFAFIMGKFNWLFFAFIIHFLFSMTSGDLASNELVFVMFALYLISNKENFKKEKVKNMTNKEISEKRTNIRKHKLYKPSI